MPPWGFEPRPRPAAWINSFVGRFKTPAETGVLNPSTKQALYLLFFELFFQWYDLDMPEAEPLPMGYSDSLTPFQVLMLIRCFRVDRIYRAVMDYVTEVLNSLLPTGFNFKGLIINIRNGFISLLK